MDAQKRIQKIINQENEAHKVKHTELLKKFNNHLTLTLDTTGNEHHFRNLNNLKIMMQDQPDINWDKLQKEDVKQLLVYIEKRDVKPKTKNKYREALKKYLDMQEKSWDEITPKGVTVYQKTGEEETDPSKIPDPEEIKKFLQTIETRSHSKTRLRNLAFFFTLWDTGARTKALVTAPLDVEIHEKYVRVTIAPVKESPKRKIDCAFAAPILKKYLDQHPDPESNYLFPEIFGNQAQENASQNRDRSHVNPDSMRSLAKKSWKSLEESQLVDVAWRQQPLHIFRKSMKTWFNNMGIQNETDIDVRAGHVIGSDYTRTYTRKSDEDSNRSLRKNLGIEEEESRDWRKVLWPKRCSGCGELNSGHRDLCSSCQETLTDKAYGYGIETENEEKVDVNLSAEIGARMARNPDKTLNEIKEEVLKQHGN